MVETALCLVETLVQPDLCYLFILSYLIDASKTYKTKLTGQSVLGKQASSLAT